MNKIRLYVVIFSEKGWSKSFMIGIAQKKIGLQKTGAAVSRQYTQFTYKLLPEQTNFERQWEVAIS